MGSTNEAVGENAGGFWQESLAGNGLSRQRVEFPAKDRTTRALAFHSGVKPTFLPEADPSGCSFVALRLRVLHTHTHTPLSPGPASC